jgi:hypothetical protein
MLSENHVFALHPTPPPLPGQANTPAPGNVLRTHCGWSFKVLDPTHPDPSLRDFVACTNCRRPYLAKYVSGQHFRCTAINCTGTQFKPVRVQPPGPLDRDPRIPLRIKGGPHNSIEDAPLGISTGTVVFEQSDTVAIQVRNNSNRTIEVPAVSCAPWFSWQWQDSRLNVRQGIDLAPGEVRTADVCVGAFRPIEDDYTLDLPNQRLLMIVSDQHPGLFHSIWIFLLILGFAHVIASVSGPFVFFVSATIWLTALMFFSPRIVHGIVSLVGLINPALCGKFRKGLQRPQAFTGQGLVAWLAVTLLVTTVAAIISVLLLLPFMALQYLTPLRVLLHFVLVVVTVNWYVHRRGYKPLRAICGLLWGRKSKK